MILSILELLPPNLVSLVYLPDWIMVKKSSEQSLFSSYLHSSVYICCKISELWFLQLSTYQWINSIAKSRILHIDQRSFSRCQMISGRKSKGSSLICCDDMICLWHLVSNECTEIWWGFHKKLLKFTIKA